MSHERGVATVGPNIVQAEFFHTTQGPSLSDVMRQNRDRTVSGSPIKTCVRFYDERDVVTKLVTAIQERESKYSRILSEMKKGESNFFRGLRLNFIQRALKPLRERRGKVITKLLQKSRRPVDVAIETNDHSYRQVESNEWHELLEAVKASTDLWLFVFAPNALLSNTQKIIARG